MAVNDSDKNFELPQEIFDELEKISKMDDTIEKFNQMVEKSSVNVVDKKDENVIKKDKVPTILTAKEKKRYENLGKAFMSGADDIISNIQNEIAKKEKASLSDKDDTNSLHNKIKNAEKKIEENKKKKSSTLKKILIAGGILGSIYLLFSNNINTAISNMYNNIKNGMLGMGDFVKKAASSIYSFFGNMFVKASKLLSGNGVLTNAVVSIIWDFFNMTLPRIVISMTEDLIKIFDSSFESTVELDQRKQNLTIMAEDSKKSAEDAAGAIKTEVSKFFLTTERDIRENGILNEKEQERLADESNHIIQNHMASIAETMNNMKTNQGNILSNWAITCTRELINNRISSTAFYDGAFKFVSSMNKLIPDLDTLTTEQIKNDKSKLNYINNFINDYGASLNMNEKQIKAYGEMTVENQLKFLRQLKSSMSNYTSDVSNRIIKLEEERKSGTDDSKRNGLASILNEIRKDAKDKDSHLKIIEFQEVRELGNLHTSIKTFISDGRYPEAVREMTTIISKKFHDILDASNKALANLTSSIANEFTMVKDDEKITVNDGDEETSKALTTEVSPMDDFKIMYIFNNNVSANEGDIKTKMETFMNHSAQYLSIIGKEMEVMTKLEYISSKFCGYSKDTVTVVNEWKKDMKETYIEHITKPVGDVENGAHIFVPPPLQSNNGGGPLSCSMGGFAAI